MPKTKKPDRDRRMIHIWLTEDVHKALRIRVAELDTTMQDFVSSLIVERLKVKGE